MVQAVIINLSLKDKLNTRSRDEVFINYILQLERFTLETSNFLALTYSDLFTPHHNGKLLG